MAKQQAATDKSHLKEIKNVFEKQHEQAMASMKDLEKALMKHVDNVVANGIKSALSAIREEFQRELEKQADEIATLQARLQLG